MAVRKKYSPEIIGGAEINRIVNNDELFGNGHMFAHVRLEKGAVVDWHIHTGEVEYYYILSGEGIYTDIDKTEHNVTTGCVCTINPNDGHAIRNENDEVLEFIALIINA